MSTQRLRNMLPEMRNVPECNENQNLQRKENYTIMEKIKKRITNLKVAGKLKVYRITVLVMTSFLVLVALISTLAVRSSIEKITEVWSPSMDICRIWRQ